MRVRTLALYLIGSRQAILDLAADRRALWVGLVFVLSAGFAREYDGRDLLREPWHLVVPVGASLAASFVLFVVACGPLFVEREGRPPFWPAFRSFLTLFWLTAPLAWLYAIPYERFLSEGAAASANLWTLAAVAAWRVALMVRVVSVLTGRGMAPSLFLVMAFADGVALAAVVVMPKPIIAVMGGVRLSDGESAIVGATLLVGCVGGLSAPVWVIGGLVASLNGRPTWQVPPAAPGPPGPSRGVWVLAAASLAVWLPVLPWTQAEQRLRTRVEWQMRRGWVAEGLAEISAHSPSDFPPHWDPPPRIGYGEQNPDLLDVVEELTTREYAPWVREHYVGKLRRRVDGPGSFSDDLRGAELARLVRVLRRLPEGPEIAANYVNTIDMLLGMKGVIPAEDREHLIALLALAGRKPPPPPAADPGDPVNPSGTR